MTSSGSTLVELVEASARHGVGRLRFAPSGEERGVDQIWAEAGQVARWLRARFGTGVRVGSFLSNTPDCPAAVFGVWRSGNDLVSLPYPGRGADPVQFLAQVVRMCELADVQVLLLDHAYRAIVPEDFPVPVATFAEAISAGGPAGDVDGSGGLIQFTSGSLGSPRGVVLSDAALTANVLAILEASGSVEGINACSWLPLSHDMGFVGMFLNALVGMGPDRGGHMFVLQTPESFLADPASWLRNCSDVRASITTAPNFAFELAVRTRKFLGASTDLSAMRVCITGAERVQAATLTKFTDTFAGAGFSSRSICPAYGMAEAALAVTMVRPEQDWREVVLDRAALGEGRLKPSGAAGPGEADGGDVVRYVSNGAVVPGMEVRVDAPDGGDVGEVRIRGRSMLTEYLGAPTPRDAEGWFSTRDIGFVEDGELFLVGRSDETIIVSGRNHYAPDLEFAVEHPSIRQGCLAAVPLEDGYALIAEPNAEADRPALEQAAREITATAARRSGLRPSLVAFVPRGSLPKTPSGKIRRVPLAAALTRGDVDLIAAVPPTGARP